MTKYTMFVDTHCHLNFPDYEKDFEDVMDRAHEAGVEKIIIPGANLESSGKAVEIAQKHDGCFAAVGIHPHEVEEYRRDVPWHVSTLRDLASRPKVVAIGETGLDFHLFPPFPPITERVKKQQAELFLAQLKIADELDLPVIIHCRDAYPDIFEVINDFYSSSDKWSEESRSIDSGQARMTKKSFSTSSNDKIRGVFHCLGGKEDDLKKVLEMGFYVGFDGNITFKNAEKLRELVKLTPLDRILLETDSPYLSPEPFRGKRNEPANVCLIAKYIAEVKGKTIDEIIKMTIQNAEKLFNFY